MTSFYTEESYEPTGNIGYLVRRVSALMTARIETVFSDNELTFVQWLVLTYLRYGLAKTAADLCREISYDSGALTRIVEHLSQRGFIERHRNADDRRLVELCLTEGGRRMVDSLKPVVVNCLNSVVEGAGLDAEEVRSLSYLLTKLIRGISVPAETKLCNMTMLESR